MPPSEEGGLGFCLLYVYSDFVVGLRRDVVELHSREIVSYSFHDVVPTGFPHLQELVPLNRRSPCKSVVRRCEGFRFAKR